MAGRKLEPVLQEMLEALDGIAAATAGKSFGHYQTEWLLRRGVERGIEIISEAARHVPDSVTERHPDIPWAPIRGIGNVLRHEYHRIADRIVWAVVEDHLPPLRRAVLEIIAEVYDPN